MRYHEKHLVWTLAHSKSSIVLALVTDVSVRTYLTVR